MKKITAFLTAWVFWLWAIVPPVPAQTMIVGRHRQVAVVAPSQSIVQYVNFATVANSGTTKSISVSSTGSGHAFLVWFGGSGFSSVPTFTETGGSDSWSNIINSTTACPSNGFSANYTCAIKYVCSGTSGVTALNFSGLLNANPFYIGFVEMSGIASSSCLDSNSQTTWTRFTASPCTSSNMSTTAGDTIIGFVDSSSSLTLAPNGAWANANAAPGSGSANLSSVVRTGMVETQLNVSSGNHAAGGTATGSPSGGCLIVGFLN